MPALPIQEQNVRRHENRFWISEADKPRSSQAPIFPVACQSQHVLGGQVCRIAQLEPQRVQIFHRSSKDLCASQGRVAAAAFCPATSQIVESF